MILDEFPLLNESGKENFIYGNDGERIHRRLPIINRDASPCGVLVDLTKIQALFAPRRYRDGNDDDDDDENRSVTSSDLDDLPLTHVDAYPLAFLRTVGNIQANGVPPCFYPLITQINKSVRKDVLIRPVARSSFDSDDEDDVGSIDGRHGENSNHAPSRQAVVKPVSSQFYNYLTHRVATRAGEHDAQHGTVTAAVAGVFAESDPHKDIAADRQRYCDRMLPSERFHEKISLDESPICCRAEIVYSVDVRALKDSSGRRVFPSIHPFNFSSLTLACTGPYTRTSSSPLPRPGNQKKFAKL